MFIPGTQIKQVIVVERDEVMHRTVRLLIESWFTKIPVLGLWSLLHVIYNKFKKIHIEVTGYKDPNSVLKWWEQILRENKPEQILVLTSNELDGMMGTQLIEQLRAVRGGERAHYVVMSGMPDDVEPLPDVPVIETPRQLHYLRDLMRRM